ncbi:hypothetical protein ACFST9_14620 [Hymenobacter monticola]|uniref:Carboxypeptidase regulatory-like domain-containing protein n=1 Tax=Hymenobacter monticola TaxID=1705399 RepID=A0ABY4BCM5_9BACT|nr:hypothetical protein [Hymenobacter monticola]UOE36654.1 hypothetical protein MTP16_25080 [Hymenobacter monticola]
MVKLYPKKTESFDKHKESISAAPTENLFQRLDVGLSGNMRSKELFCWIPKGFNSFLLLLLVAALSACDSTTSTDTTGNSTAEATTAAPGPTVLDSADYEPPVSPYAGNQLSNGKSPLDNCFGKGRYSGSAWINFSNSNNSTDAIVCLARASDNKVIRNEYIRSGTDFKMSRIPAGTYYLKVFSGKDWNPTRKSACGTKGYFDSDQSFSESKDEGNLIKVMSNSRGYTTGSITLYTVSGGNMAQAPINADEFFRQ